MVALALPRKVKMKEARGDRAFLFGIYAFLVVVILIIAIPVIYIVAASFSSASAVLGGKVWLWPVGFTLTGYKAVFDYPEIGRRTSTRLSTPSPVPPSASC